jgi:nucleotide-binding universal stress UspA family protein
VNVGSPSTDPLADLVVGTDGSPASIDAFRWALVQARGGHVTAVHGFSPATELFAAAAQVNLDPVRAEHKRLLESAWTPSNPEAGVEVDTELVDDTPRPALVEVARRRGGIPIVIGRRHHRHLAHHVDTLASQLLTQSEVPFVITPEATRADPLSGPIVVGVTGRPGPEQRPLSFACGIAGPRGLGVHLVAVAEPVFIGPGRGYPVTAYERDRADLMRASAASTKDTEAAVRSAHPGLEVTSEVRQGHPTECIRDAIDELDAVALVVIGNSHHSKLASVVSGSVARQLPPLLSAPVAVVPDT